MDGTVKVQRKAGFLQIFPFIVFITIFLGSMFFFSAKTSPVFACLIAVIVSFFTFTQSANLDQKIQLFIEGSARPSVITICYIFILTSAFSHIFRVIGGIDAVVNLSLYFLPQSFLLPGFFLVVSLFATAIGTSLGAIAAFLPLGLTLAAKMDINIALMAGLVVCGAMLGDNLSVISDTTIAATQIAGAKMTDKFKANAFLVLPALLFTVFVLAVTNVFFISPVSAGAAYVVTAKDYLFLLPYCMILFLALAGINVLAVVLLALFTSLGIGVYLGSFTCFEGSRILFHGFVNNEGGIVEMVVYVLAKSGLSYIVECNGGVDFLVKRFNQYVASRAGAEIVIAVLTVLVNMAVAVAAVSILVVGPVAKKLADQFDIKPRRTACLLDVFSSICQSVLPYGAPLILAGTLTGLSSLQIIPFLYYQFSLAIMVTATIIRTSRQQKRMPVRAAYTYSENEGDKGLGNRPNL